MVPGLWAGCRYGAIAGLVAYLNVKVGITFQHSPTGGLHCNNGGRWGGGQLHSYVSDVDIVGKLISKADRRQASSINFSPANIH